MKINNSDFLIIGAIILLGISIITFSYTLFNLTQSDSITGFATTDTGNVSLDVSGAASIEFTVDTIDWGSGAVNTSAGATYALLNTAGTVNNGSWSAVSDPLNLTNTGNADVSVNFTSNKNADTFITGTNPVFNISVTNVYTGACDIANFSTYQAIDTNDYLICNNFNYTDTNDTVNVGVQLVIPEDATAGDKEAIITATAETV